MFSVVKVQSLLMLKGCGTYSNHSELITEENGVVEVSPVGLRLHIAACSQVVLRYSRWRITKWNATVAVYHQYLFVNGQDWLKEGLIYVTLPAVSRVRKYRVSQEEWTKLRESVPYVELYRYNPKHLYPKLNGYGDNGQIKVWTSCISAYCTSTAVSRIDLDNAIE